MTARRASPGPSRTPFWTMLLAVWALVLGGAGPTPAREAVCGVPAHPAHHQDGLACCPLMLSGPVQALVADSPAIPLPGGAALGRTAVLPPPAATPAVTLLPRARGPPRSA